MIITPVQMESLNQARKQDFVLRLDRLLCGYSEGYAAMAPERRVVVLAGAVEHSQAQGIHEELNIGLFVLAVLVFGSAALREAQPQAILADVNRTGTAKVYQLWHWCRQRLPQSPIFAPPGPPI